MTLEEAEKIGEVILYADGGCADCVQQLCYRLNDAFPEYKWEREGYRDPGSSSVIVTKRETNNAPE